VEAHAVDVIPEGRIRSVLLATAVKYIFDKHMDAIIKNLE